MCNPYESIAQHKQKTSRTNLRDESARIDMYDENKTILLFLISILVFIFQVGELKKEIKRIRTIKIGFSDENIEAIVIGSLYMMGGAKPILQYTVNGIQNQYTYHFYCSSSKYFKGEKVILKISKNSGLAYDKIDIIKAILYELICTMFIFSYLIITVCCFAK